MRQQQRGGEQHTRSGLALGRKRQRAETIAATANPLRLSDGQRCWTDATHASRQLRTGWTQTCDEVFPSGSNGNGERIPNMSVILIAHVAFSAFRSANADSGSSIL